MGCVVPLNRFPDSKLKEWVPISDKCWVLGALGLCLVVEWIQARLKELSVPVGMNL